MKRGHLITATLATLAAFPLLGTSSAWAGPCVAASVATYEASGFSCSVGSMTFSDIVVNTITNGSGTVTLGDFAPFMTGNESGLSLSYAANTGTTASSVADVAWTYNVAGTPDIVDAFASFTGTVTGTGTAALSETLSNGVTLSLNSPGATTVTFAPVATLGVIKDQNDFAGSAGSSETSILENGFSTAVPVPEPASVALFGTGLLGLGLIGRRRKSV